MQEESKLYESCWQLLGSQYSASFCSCVTGRLTLKCAVRKCKLGHISGLSCRIPHATAALSDDWLWHRNASITRKHTAPQLVKSCLSCRYV
jgi:hypothetical protein